MLRNTLFILALTAAPAVAQQPAAAQNPAPAKPAQAHAMAADTTKAKAHKRMRRNATTKAKAKGAATRDTTARRDSVKP